MKLSGSLSANREIFRADYEDYALATGLVDKDKKVQATTLRSVIGVECRHVYKHNLNLTDAQQEDAAVILDSLESVGVGTLWTMRAKAADMHGKDCVKVAVRVRPFNKCLARCDVTDPTFLKEGFLIFKISLLNDDIFGEGGNRSTQRKLTPTPGTHANSIHELRSNSGPSQAAHLSSLFLFILSSLLFPHFSWFSTIFLSPPTFPHVILSFFIQRERDAGSRCIISMTSSTITIQDPRNNHNHRSFCFDYAYWSHSGFTRDRSGLFLPGEPGGRYADQGSVFQDLGEGILENTLQGYNATLLAYGQTGSGKSYSMMGYGPNKGLVPTLCDHLFQAIKKNQDTRQCQVFFSMLEIYNEQVVDLLSRGSRAPGGLRVREEQQRGFYVEGLRTVPCDSALQVGQLMEQGIRTRTTAATHMNANSSRSHMLIILQLKQIFSKESITKHSNVNLVDLAGSERQRVSGSEADRLKEGTAINLSLTTLGNVISALADVAVGKKVVHIPYRDSVLTKLLQSALGGNSRTVMIATLSPADICYEESLSTLRYAERAKRIQNRAVVNESPTERLVKELKAENGRLLQRLSRLGQEGRRADDETKELRQLLTHNELQIRAIQTLWEQHLQEALKDWELQYASITQERRMMQMHPYILNINEDPQLSGVVKLFIQEGDWDIGLSDSSNRSISIKGLGIQEHHAVFRNEQRRVSLAPTAASKVIINGTLISQTTELQHLDRLILGSNSTYLFIGYPSERGVDDWSRYDYDYFQSELAAAEGIHLGEPNAESSQTDPSLLAVFYDYIKLMPMVAEANQMSQELNKGVEFKLEIKNLALSDSKGHDLEKEIVIRVTSLESKQVWMWSKAKFVNRKFLMEEVYQQHQTEQSGGKVLSMTAMPRDKDPFWDPLEPLLLGSAHLWLQSLAFRIALEEQLEVLGSEGTEEAILQAQLVPCTPTGLTLSEDDILIDPSELLGRRLDFQLVLDQCCGLRWIKEVRNRGVQIGFRLFDCSQPLYTPAVWHNVNPLLDHRVHFASLHTSQTLLDYLQSSALVLELWGLQEGCSDLTSSLEGVRMTTEGIFIIDEAESTDTAPVESIELSCSVRALQQNLEELKSVNASLSKENHTLREQLNTARNGGDCTRGRSLRPSCDAEFARALKVFYHSMTSVRGQLQRLRRHRPSEESDLLGLRFFVDEQSRLLRDFSEQLEQSVSSLKQDVAAIVRRKRERSGIWS
ncbi:kinesin-like protein KIF28 [Lampris incognitus]|uniref:kinesin-like protein KIF28 n=1 Tax=Lampris incognitus TaxID=2546036 RepID=UPI0024B55644|nr:kinesin-like protein KIF28 [Lampris incognitus]